MEVLAGDKLGYWNNLISLFFKACEYCIKGFGSELRTIMHKNYRTVTKSFMSGDGFYYAVNAVVFPVKGVYIPLHRIVVTAIYGVDKQRIIVTIRWSE